MERLVVIGALFVLAGLCEIGGGYLVWGWVREGRPLVWALLGAGVLAAYGVVAALQPISEFGRVYAAYGGVFIALALVWGVLVDGFRPDRWDLLGASICVVGVLVMVGPHEGRRPYSPECVEGLFPEVRLLGVLRSSSTAGPGPRRGPRPLSGRPSLSSQGAEALTGFTPGS